jgi:lantibiotic modifying enzyme
MALAAAPILQQVDHLCCGNAGRIDALAGSSGAGDRAARRIAAAMLDRRERVGAFRLHDPASTRGLHCGLFQGVAGIGHALLRLVDPALPSALAW